MLLSIFQQSEQCKRPNETTDLIDQIQHLVNEKEATDKANQATYAF